jgi:fructose-1,6-bisphosphatase II
MEKIAVGPEAADAIDIEAPAAENVRRVAQAKGVRPSDISVVVLDRDRHVRLIEELRESGARVLLIRDGDVAPTIAAARPDSGVDMVMGIGGTPEGVISAAAIKCVGGAVQGRLAPQSDSERQLLAEEGLDLSRVFTTDELVSGQYVFVAATGVTPGALLRGVRYSRHGAITDSIVMRSRSGTVRMIEAQHPRDKLELLGAAAPPPDTGA